MNDFYYAEIFEKKNPIDFMSHCFDGSILLWKKNSLSLYVHEVCEHCCMMDVCKLFAVSALILSFNFML